MKRTIWLKVLGLAAAAMFVLIVAGSTQAALLVSEPFDYTLSTNLAGNGTGTGWTSGSNWVSDVVAGGTQPTTYSATIAAGLTFGAYSTSGNAVALYRNGNPAGNTVHIHREMAVTSGSELWFSSLYKCDGTDENRFQAFGTLANGTTFPSNDAGNLRVKTNVTANNSVDPTGGWIQSQLINLSGSPYPATTGTQNANLDGNVYMIVAQFTSVNPTVAGKYDRAKVWLLSVANYTALGGVYTVANLDANSTQKHASNDADAASEVLYFDGSDVLQYRYRGDTTITLDEIKWGDTAGDVVPEPATMALLAIGGLGMLIGRRRRA